MARGGRPFGGDPNPILIPWWVYLLIAAGSHVFFHWLAQPVAPPKGALGLITALLRVLPWVGQFLVPALLVLLAISSAIQAAEIRRSRRTDRIEPHTHAEGSAPSPQRGPEPDRYPEWTPIDPTYTPLPPVGTKSWSLELLRLLEWKRFEQVCAAYFEALGFRARLAPPGPDGGVDIHLYLTDSPTASIVVQCKAWQGRVGVEKIRALYGVMAADKVSEGIFATTGLYSADAKAFAAGKNIHLIDGDDFLRKLRALPDDKQAAILQLAVWEDFTTPTCPSCGIKMVERTPRSGGDKFWGCRNFPRCGTKLNMRRAT
jgi:restriction system protein